MTNNFRQIFGDPQRKGFFETILTYTIIFSAGYFVKTLLTDSKKIIIYKSKEEFIKNDKPHHTDIINDDTHKLALEKLNKNSSKMNPVNLDDKEKTHPSCNAAGKVE